METGAGLGAVHAAVAGQEGAAPAQGEAVGGVVTQEALGPQHRGHPEVMMVTSHLGQVSHRLTRHRPRPLEAAVTQQRVTRQLVHVAHAWARKRIRYFGL